MHACKHTIHVYMHCIFIYASVHTFMNVSRHICVYIYIHEYIICIILYRHLFCTTKYAYIHIHIHKYTYICCMKSYDMCIYVIYNMIMIHYDISFIIIYIII